MEKNFSKGDRIIHEKYGKGEIIYVAGLFHKSAKVEFDEYLPFWKSQTLRVGLDSLIKIEE